MPSSSSVLRNACGERLDYTLTPGHPPHDDLVVVGHGVTSHKDRPWLITLCDALAAAGIGSLRLSFAGNGASEGRFAEATISKEVTDLGSVLDALPGQRIAYAGHSMGAAVGVLRAALDPRIQALVSLAGMVHVTRFMRTQFGALTPGRDLMFDKPQCVLPPALLADAEQIGSVSPAAQQIRVPWLLVHGTADELVPYQDALDAQTANAGRPEIVKLDGADHRFGGCESQMAAAVVAWLQRLWR